MSLEEKIANQKEKIEKGNPKIELLGSCRPQNGIQILNAEETIEAIRLYENRANDLDISFFIPSSGSGSRMFGAAYDFINNENPCEETIEFIEHLINSIASFAFYNKFLKPQKTI